MNQPPFPPTKKWVHLKLMVIKKKYLAINKLHNT